MTQAAFDYVDGTLHAERVSTIDLAERFGTPLFVYSRAALTAAYEAYAKACAGRRASIHVAVKANSNLGVLNVFARLGAGFDIVSGGELARVLAAGGRARDVVFSGVGKSADEMRVALEAGVKCFNVESIPELDRLNAVAASLGKRAPVSLRVNPDVDPKTHPYISTGLKANKFGIAFDDARATYRAAAALPNLEVVGIDCHIGSQITELSPYLDAIDKLLDLVERIEADGVQIHHVDVGGGLGITYDDETPPDIGAYVRAVLARIDARGHGQREIWFEPGRSLTGNAGILLTRVEFLKQGEEKNFAIVDAAMNDLARPAMYQAFHAIVPVAPRTDVAAAVYDIVGPVCESGDWLGRERSLAIAPGDLLAIRSAGAYGFTMSSNYNTRPRAAEVIVDGANAHLVRPRETVESLFEHEAILPEGR
ncbi:diaminopimelate decarboxylase [Burkholderia pseudomallei MSHR4377]|uniref:diaminopimelate decarboxylase n=1 Tax=Burkholderia pseudomallei TaxID=28450 RepID=UPI00050F13DA|nr:diaminopimelate decarboxylase [Burkholderia pseudomallei]AIS87247.1 diaminopimelate decarboxylase [Burkholderia pseudomallei NAU35A-3]KGC76435.1 diaminopimelate decarboxylase [Burkholderia pseudomallei]KGS83941.1 diaminopimelate decarboxylase [Burkholderia pseudomallei MSHR7500]KGU94634.1 diaminopimelate decarboxylase [Burkholderia pseudomallei MSHR4377]KGV12606.1 diaminopimelate decarboxylase [Burkholderia pseudomallei TSV 43]